MNEAEIPRLLAHFTVVPDPRAHNVCHKLEDILVIAICAVVSGADTFSEIEQYGQGKQAWLEKMLELPNGIPSHDTFRRVFMLLDAEAWQSVFFRWTQSLVLKKSEAPTEVRAVDGKWSRASGLHTVSVCRGQNFVIGRASTTLF